MFDVTGRIQTINRVEHLFGYLSVSEEPSGSLKQPLEGDDKGRFIYVVPERLKNHDALRHVYNMPFLLNKDGTAWLEANSYLVSLVQYEHINKRPTDYARRVASQLLSYKVFSEEEEFDWLDFSAKRVSSRPTYRYFNHLVYKKKLKPAVVNQYTASIYKFYEWLAETKWHPIDMNRVDSMQRIKKYVEGKKGGIVLDIKKRKLSKRVPQSAAIPIGFVRDDGEDLRPLREVEFAAFLNAFKGSAFDAQEKLIILLAVETGARKQSILTLRERHIRDLYTSLSPENKHANLLAGPGTGIDTKNDKDIILQFPVWLVGRLVTFVESPFYKKRKAKFLRRFRDELPDLAGKIDQVDSYAFLSDQGNCYYMAKNDPRYTSVKTVQKGQMTHYLQKKIIDNADTEFPTSFRFHWLRASFAFRLYKALGPAIASGSLDVGDQISYIQERMHHEQRETTENYLKLFQDDSTRLNAQEKFEDHYSDELSILLAP